MNRKGIGWFKLDLVTYPEHTCFLDACIQKNEMINGIAEKENRALSSIKRQDELNGKIDHSEKISAVLIMKTEVVI